MRKKNPVRQISHDDIITRYVLPLLLFPPVTVILYWFFQDPEGETLTFEAQKWLYPLCVSVMLGALVSLWVSMQFRDKGYPKPKHGRFFYPVISGALAVIIMFLAYIYLGVWPIGDKSVMLVDMHHQYAPLLSMLRDMFLHGGSPLYSFEVGLGTNFLPLFGYYLASPFNLLLVFFPDWLLSEGIFLITLLKIGLSSAFFAACVQYVYHRRDFCVPAVAIMYGLMMYMLAYSWNIMWLDSIMILPLIILFFERMMRTGKFLGYVLTLAYALFTNYYIGFMICIFLVLYYIVYALRKRRTLDRQLHGFSHFALGSLLAGGLVMFLLIPVYIGLGHTSAAGGSVPGEWKTNFELFDLLGRHLFSTSPTIRSGNLPNIYCGMLSVLLLPIFATMKTISRRRRVSYLALAALLAVSMLLNVPNLLWHGLHAPNDLPYRFSFLYSFVLLLIAFETLTHVREIRLSQLGGAFVGIAAYLMLEGRFGDDDIYGFKQIYVSLFLVLVYAFILSLVTFKKRRMVRPAYCLLLLVVAAEMILNSSATLKQLNTSEYYTTHNGYVDNDTTRAIQEAVERIEAKGDDATGDGFYRLQFYPNRTSMDTALFQFHGITAFASSNYYDVTKFMGNVGYANNGVNSYIYKQFVSPIDSLLGIRYVFADKAIPSLSEEERFDTVTVGSSTYYLYENPHALPLGYLVNSDIKNWQPGYYNPFESQNNLFIRMTGNTEPIYQFQQVTVKEDSSNASMTNDSAHAFYFNPSSGGKTANFTCTLSQGGQTYIYLECGASSSMSASVAGNTWQVKPREPYILDAGILNAGETISASVTADSACSGNIYVVTLNENVYEQNIQALASGGLDVTSFSDSHIEANLEAGYAGTIFTSIPYDSSWTVKVDGKKVETFEACNSMLAFDVAAGSHTVEFSFFPAGLALGIVASIISLAAIILLLWASNHGKIPFGARPEPSLSLKSGQPTVPPSAQD